MKKIIFIVLALTVTATAFSQSFQDEVKLMQSVYGKDKKEIVAEFIELNSGQEDAFWKLYDEYETKRKEIWIN